MIKMPRSLAPKKPHGYFLAILTTLLVFGIGVLAFMRLFGLALCLGLSAGGSAFLPGVITGGRLGNARAVGHARQDTAMRVGALLALAGIAAGAQAHDPPWAWPLRLLIGLGQLAASLLAVWLAAQNTAQTQTVKDTNGRDDLPAEPL